MRLTNYSLEIDPNMKDESGYSFDIGARSEKTQFYNYDISCFYLNYDNRIGEIQFYNEYDRVLRRRGNIGQAVIMGIESYAEADFLRILRPKEEHFSGVLFVNAAFIQSEYKKSASTAVVGKQVEFVPKVNTKTGIRLGWKELKASFQYSYLSNQFSDATNAKLGGETAIVGLIPAYEIMDISLSYQFKWLKVEGSVNNLADAMYFTRRATGYPGPGILPSDGRTYYLTLQVKI
jgi:Fe(3+) dicitrate transport protein